MKLALVIPTYKPHLVYLRRLCENIAEQTRLPDLVIIRASSCDTAESLTTITEVLNHPWPYPLEILHTPRDQYQAQNRNEGADAVPEHFDSISFFDSDDWMHPRRLELVEAAFLQGAEAVFHQTYTGNSYTGVWEAYPDPPKCHWNAFSLQKESAVQDGNQIISRSVFAKLYPQLVGEITFFRPIPMDEALEEEICMPFGYASVLRKVFKAIRFDEEALGYEDAKFVSEIVLRRYKTAGICAKLAYYRVVPKYVHP
jgi:hypothetical protein